MNVISAVEKLKQANNQLTEMERRVREANDDTTRDAARHARATAIDAYDAAYDAYTAACSGREVVKYAD